MSVPFFSLAEQTESLRSEVMKRLGEVVDAQAFISGPFVEKFEKELAAYLGVAEVVGLNSGTSALHGALICAGVMPGDEVITVAHTWISTAWAISYAGATPVFVDIDASTCCMDPIAVESAITRRTRAIIPVHLYGGVTELDPILKLAERNRIAVIEDCAQSIGARYHGRMTGTFGSINATSFYPGKNLGAFGEGGAILTNNREMAERVRQLRDHAQAGRHHHVELGFNWRMDGFQGAILSLKLPLVDGWNERRREIAERYVAAFDPTGVRMLRPIADSEPIWHIFPIFHEDRERVRKELLERGIQTSVHYPTPIHLQPAYAHLGLTAGALPHSERAAATEISLPMYPELTDDEVDEVIAAVTAVVG